MNQTSSTASTIPTATAIVYLLWFLTAATFIAAWAVMLSGVPRIAVMLGFTTGVLAASAVVVTVRSYVMRTCSLIRALHGLDGDEAPRDLHPIT